MVELQKIIEVSEATFDRDVLEQSKERPVVVDFWAPWCGPCRVLGPLLERLASEPGSDFVLAKLNVDDNPSLATYYGVQGIPAVKAFRDGRVVDEFVGAQPEAQVRAFLRRIAPSERYALLEEAAALLKIRAWAKAETIYRGLLEAAPADAARVGLAQALLGQGEGCEAEQLLHEVEEASVLATTEQLLPLAAYLCRIGEEAQGEGQPVAVEYRQAGDRLKSGELEEALQLLLKVLQQDKDYREGEARKAMLGLFALLGDEDPLTQQYRPQLAMILF